MTTNTHNTKTWSQWNHYNEQTPLSWLAYNRLLDSLNCPDWLHHLYSLVGILIALVYSGLIGTIAYRLVSLWSLFTIRTHCGLCSIVLIVIISCGDDFVPMLISLSYTHYPLITKSIHENKTGRAGERSDKCSLIPKVIYEFFECGEVRMHSDTKRCI